MRCAIRRGAHRDGANLQRADARTVWSVVVPASAPLIIAGLRLSVAAALITTVVAEMIVGAGGIGAYIVLMEQAARMPEVYAAVIVLSASGYAINRVMVAVERRWLPWHAARRGVTLYRERRRSRYYDGNPNHSLRA